MDDVVEAPGDGRQNPDSLLAAVEKEDAAARRGHLKIFFGYAAGVGKTYAMLKAAHAARRRGVDVVAGYIEPHARPKTAALARGLETIPPKLVEAGGSTFPELDLDAVLKRAPQLVLVDELAHTCAAGSRHQKRYQDVAEILHAGIDVYTTVNVQHIESLNDMVAGVTGVIVRERIPDAVFDDADQVELVDIEPADLLERLREGEIYAPGQAKRAMSNFFTVENLTALREIALRRCADRMNLLSREARAKSNRDYHTDEHVLVCISPSRTNPTIVRTAARMAAAFQAEFTALYVKTPDADGMPDADERQLRANLDLAEQLGAKVATATGDDVAYQIAEFARLSGVSKLVLGRNTARRSPLGRASLVDRLTGFAPNLDVYIIPDRQAVSHAGVPASAGRRPWRLPRPTWPRSRDLAITGGLLVGATAAGYLFLALGFAPENITSLYILATLACAVATSNRLCAVGLSFASVLVFNFCFAEPRYTLVFAPIYGPTFLVMLATALISSMLTSHIKDQARLSALTAYRTKVLFDTDQLLARAETEDDVLHVTARQLVKLLDRDVVLYARAADAPSAEGRGTPRLAAPFIEQTDIATDDTGVLTEGEAAIAQWVLKNNKRAGAGTSTLPDSHCLYLAIRAHDEVYGVVGIVVDGRPLDAFENSTVLSLIGQCALVLEGKRAARERQEAALLARNERLRANLLRSIGHDLRTPLMAISGSASVLRSDGAVLAPEKRAELLGSIDDNARWLINLVENLLAVTRIEDGSLKLNRVPELLDEVVGEAVGHTAGATSGHEVRVEPTDDLLMARMDARLIMQVVVNLVDNAAKYSPAGTLVDVRLERQGGSVACEVADEGPGVPDDEKDRVFEAFHTVHGVHPVDGRRSLGLGLSLCRSIVEAHGGRIWVRDNHPRGAVFGFSLPACAVPDSDETTMGAAAGAAKPAEEGSGPDGER